MKSKEKKVSSHHSCELTQELQIRANNTSPITSTFQRWKYSLREISTIEKNRVTSQYFRSNATFLKERGRHQRNRKYQYTIHPLSGFLKWKSVIVLLCWLYIFVMDPLLGTYLGNVYLDESKITAVRTVNWFFHTLMNIDIIIRFFTGYIVEKTGQVVLDRTSIVKRYLKFYFWIDFIPNIGFVLTWATWEYETKIQLLLYQIKNIRLLRFFSAIECLDEILNRFGIESTGRTLFPLVIAQFYIIHWWTCFIALVPIIRELYDHPMNDSWLMFLYEKRSLTGGDQTVAYVKEVEMGMRNYKQFLQIVVSHFYGAGTDQYKSSDRIEMFTFSFILMSGLAYNIIVLAQILQLFGTVNISEARFEDLILQLVNYLIQQEAPKSLEKKILKYYDIKYNHKFFSQSKIDNILSEHLRMEVVLYSCMNLIERVQVFKGLSRAAVGSVLALLERNVFLPGDIVMSSDREKDGNKLFFILYGTCMVQSMSSVEALHLEDGNHFGEVSMLVKKNPTKVFYKVIALEATEVYVLTEKNLEFCCKLHPEIQDKLESFFKGRINFYKQIIEAASDKPNVQNEEILEELRRERIVRPGIRRDAFGHTIKL